MAKDDDADSDGHSNSSSFNSYGSRSRSPSPRRHDKENTEADDAKGGKRFDLTIAICKDFTRGRCSRSQLECKYAHPPPIVAVDGETVTVCYDSLRDRCARGYTCRYFHPPPHLRIMMQESTGIQPSPVPLGYQANPGRSQNALYGTTLMQPPPLPAAVPPLPKVSTRPSIEVCRDFLRGRCKRDANDCRYAHHTPSAGDGEYVIVCQDFIRGKCNRDACRYFHAPNHLRSRIKDLPMGTASDHIPYNAPDHTSYSTGLDGSYSYAADPYEHQAAKRMRLDDLSIDLHHTYSAGAYYGGGQGASLYQISSLPPTAPPPVSLQPPTALHPAPVMDDQDRLPVCRDFLRLKCSRATACRFVHPESHVQVVDNYVTVCRDFLRGKCKREKCRFHHPITKIAARRENGSRSSP